MIYISQGHEKSIGLEVLIKSFLLLTQNEQKKFTLVCYKDSLVETLSTLNFSFKINNQKVCFAKSTMECLFLEMNHLPQSTHSLLTCLDIIEKNNFLDILVTLPTSKDQLILQNENKKGHTEFFRSHFKKDGLSMIFSSHNLTIMLITDHIPLNRVSEIITEELIIEKISMTLEGHQKYFFPFEEVVISGINPHAGENGLLGVEDKKIKTAISQLRKKYTKLMFTGPLSGDTLLLHKRENAKQLFVYMYHDQGLSLFKSLYGFMGINITLGLPFLRMSVDHGTAFELFGKNSANFQGSLFLLKQALKSHSKI